MFITSVLLSLCLALPNAHGSTPPTTSLIIGDGDTRMRVTTSTDVYGVTAEVESDAGSEELTLTESDTHLHGSAAIAALPSVDSRVTLILYDTASASPMSFSGTLGADGSVSVTADAPACEPSSRAACTTTTGPDIEVLAAELFLGAAGGYDVAFDLNGADAHDVAYADIVITESTEVTTCEKGGACTTTVRTTTTEAEVNWDTISAVWEGALRLGHEGVIEIKAKTLDSRGKKIETVKAKLGAPWIDSGAGINALATDEDPLTAVALGIRRYPEEVSYNGREPSWDTPMEVPFISVVSEGWSATTVPVSAQVELTNGETITIPANSYQRTALIGLEQDGIHTTTYNSLMVRVAGGAISLDGSSVLSADDLASPLCADGYCVLLRQEVPLRASD